MYDKMIDFCNLDGDLKVVKFHYFTVEKISKMRMIGYFSLLLKIPTTGHCNTGFTFIVSTGVNKSIDCTKLNFTIRKKT